MPIGPNGEKRPADPIANAGQRAGGRKGGAAGAARLSSERRREIVREGAAARWGK